MYVNVNIYIDLSETAAAPRCAPSIYVVYMYIYICIHV